jgi:hypothetical protein
MDKPKINNLIAKVQGRDLTLRQCADATRELNKMILYTEELEQLILSGVSQRSELCEGKCGMSYCNENGCLDKKEVLVEPKDTIIVA